MAVLRLPKVVDNIDVEAHTDAESQRQEEILDQLLEGYRPNVRPTSTNGVNSTKSGGSEDHV